MKDKTTRIGALLVLILALVAMPVYAVREGIAIDAQEDVWLYRGADFVMYSDNHVSPVFSVDGSTGYVSNPGAGLIYVDDDMEINGSLTVTELISQSITVSATDDLIAADDLTVGDDAIITGTLRVVETSDLRGNVADSAGTFTVADDVLIDGQADAVQLTVQGHSSQTAKPFVVENSGGTDQFTVSNTGDVALLGALSQVQVNAASGSANPFDYTGTLGIMNGSDDFTLFDVNITNADHTSTGNTVQALDIAGITADAHATESAVKFGAGWDSDLNGTTSLELASDDVVVVTVKDPAGADSAATNEMVEIAGTTPVDTTGTNVHDFLTIDAAIGNSSGGTNSVRGVQLDNITGDAQVTESAINVGTGWDYGFVSASPVRLTSSLSTTDEIAQVLANEAGASANPYDYTGTAGIMDGSDDLTIFDINLTNADHTGSTNTIQAIDVSGITADDHATETAVNIGAGWDSGITNASPTYLAGAVNLVVDVSIITTDTLLTAADSGTHVVFKNQSAFLVTATLPDAAAGLNFCFTNYEGDDVQVDAQAADQIVFLTSATGEEIDNSTAGNWVCLVAIDGTDWLQTSIGGTWTDD